MFAGTMMITSEQIKKLLESFNGRADFVASDFIVAKAFSEAVNLASHFSRVAILDGLFNTSLRQSRPAGGRQRLAMVTMSENIRLRLPDIVDLVEGLPTRTLFGLASSRFAGQADGLQVCQNSSGVSEQ